MWAAANDGRNKRRRHHESKKQRRQNDDDDITQEDSSSDEYYGSNCSSSSDDEHSTTITTAKTNENNNEPKKVKKKKKKRRRGQYYKPEETAEATISRITSSYTTAMGAVGALWNVSKQYCKVWNNAENANNNGDSSNDIDIDIMVAQNNKIGGDDNEHQMTFKKQSSNHEKEGEAYKSIQHVANAARAALEQSLLTDPIVLSSIINTTTNSDSDHATAASTVMKSKKIINRQQMDNNNNNSSLSSSSAWFDTYSSSQSTSSTSRTTKKWSKLSMAHINTIRQITYLTLVNYADLLLCGFVVHSGTGHAAEAAKEEGDTNKKKFLTAAAAAFAEEKIMMKQKMDILDKGAVSKLDILFKILFSDSNSSAISNKNSSFSLWSESTERTIRLALSAYCDATELDSSDPTLWLKLACAARALGREIDVGKGSSSTSSGPPSPPMTYRCLERLALDRGLSALPHGVPPNRLLLRAWKEMEYWDKKEEDNSSSSDDVAVVIEEDTATEDYNSSPTELVLHLPRYSWTSLGRILIQACKEGISYDNNTYISEDNEFGSPLIDMRISPLLAIPSIVLGNISKYLDDNNVCCLRCTCMEFSSTSALRVIKPREQSVARANSEVEKDDADIDIYSTGEDAGKEETTATMEAFVNEPGGDNRDIGESANGLAPPTTEDSAATKPLDNTKSQDEEGGSPSKQSSSPMSSSPLKLARLSAGVSASPKEEIQQEGDGFEFNGNIYPTYQEMVAAKRERNRKALEKATGEISSFLGSEYNNASNESQPSNKPKQLNLKKRGRTKQGGTKSADSTLPQGGRISQKVGRVSKRVRSQMITSEKQTERKSKRASVEYSLLAGVLSCTAQNPYYANLLKEDITWENLPQIRKCMEDLIGVENSSDKADIVEKASTIVARPSESNAFLAATSLNSFITKWSGHNSGPKNLAEIFLRHVSLNACEVFEVESNESLSSCVIDCFNMMIANAGRSSELLPWYGPFDLGSTKVAEDVHPFVAVNLLYAELLLKRCESYDIGSDEHQVDSDILAFMVPKLISFPQMAQTVELQCRCYWLASTYYLWIGRCSNDASIAKEADDMGLDWLHKIMELFSSNEELQHVMTPHLQSPHRRGEHWSVLSSDTLSKYKELIQSTSAVSEARQRFRDIQNEVNGRSQPTGEEQSVNTITTEDKAKFGLLGVELLERFDVNSEKANEVMDELLKDFLLLHEDGLLISDDDRDNVDMELVSDWDGKMHWGRIWSEIPSSSKTSSNEPREDSSRPSIIQVLASSIVSSEENIPKLFLVFIKIALTALLSQGPIGHDNKSKPTIVEGDGGENAIINKKDHLLMLVADLFIDKMADMVKSYAGKTDMSQALETYLAGEDFDSLIMVALNDHVGKSFHQMMNRVQSVLRLVHILRDCQELSRESQQKVESFYFTSLVKTFTRQKAEFIDLTSSVNDKRLKKWQIQITDQAELIFVTANEIAELLSLNPTIVNKDGSASVSHLIKAISGQCGKEQGATSVSTLAQFTESLLWFWRFLSNTFDVVTPTEKSVRDRLMVTISSSIIALCASPGVSVDASSLEASGMKGDDYKLSADESCLNISDYFESDDSVNGLFQASQQRAHRVLLRKVCQLVQCISLVFKFVDMKLIRQEDTSSRDFPSSQHGPFLPLVVTRALSSISEGTFQLFSEDISSGAYPYGARECGSMIDNLLGKAYSYLHGFSFSGGDSGASKSYAPESIKAATQLFRCIKRVYHDGRKSPPSKAFEAVEMALPRKEESEVSKAMKQFLFDANKDVDVIRDGLPPGFPAWVFESAAGASTSPSNDEEPRDVEQLRRDVAHEIAKGDIADLDTPSDTDDQGLSIERESTQRNELNLYQNFRAVLNDLCYNPNNVDGWVKLSECLGFKSEGICDRIVRLQDPYDSSEFCLNNKSKREHPATTSLDEVKEIQLEEFQTSRNNWKPFIGNNLLIYVKYPWSNLSSLEAFAKEVGSSISTVGDASNIPEKGPVDGDSGDTSSDYVCWKEIESKFEKGDYVAWANSWAGIFIAALRAMRLKALLVARYLAKKNQNGGGMHPSEVCEDLGTALYADLMASGTVYGYPIYPMSDFEKRRIAECSKFYFREAMKLSTSSNYSQKCQTVSHELHFMIGKCYEKIASTLKEEIYQPVDSPEVLGRPTRLYETTMNDAIRNYSKACVDAEKAEKASSAGLDKASFGGSTHGAIEYLYRLHASRFKVLISAVRRAEEECELAELEAFRITSTKWFDESNESSSASGVRGKTWDVFADCVDGKIIRLIVLQQCVFYCHTSHLTQLPSPSLKRIVQPQPFLTVE